MFRTMSQIVLNYRATSLSEGRAGWVQGGDRLPWVEVADGTPNFSLLRWLRWQVHVYGHAPAVIRSICRDHALPLHEIGWHHRFAAAGLQRDAPYLIRPDGYVALAAPINDAEALRRYLARSGLSPSDPNRLLTRQSA